MLKKNANSVQWDGPHKRISFDLEDPESTLSGSETRPGWPPDDMCADSTRYKGSFDEREREGLQLLSPVVRRKVLKLQRDLEEDKAESRYLRARPVDSPVVDTNRSRFTMTPVPRYDGVSDWDQYRKVFEAIDSLEWMGRPDCCPTVDCAFGWGSPERGFIGTR